MHVLTLSALLVALGVSSGCATKVEYIEVLPHCEPVITPFLPDLDRGLLWDKLGDEHFRQVEEYIGTLWGVIDEQTVIITSVCAS